MSWFKDVVNSFTDSFSAVGDLLTGDTKGAHDNWTAAIRDSNKAVGNGDSSQINYATAGEFFVGGWGIGAAAGGAAAASASAGTTATGAVGGATASAAAKFAIAEGVKIGVSLQAQAANHGFMDDINAYLEWLNAGNASAMDLNPYPSATTFSNSPELAQNYAPNDVQYSVLNAPKSNQSATPFILGAGAILLAAIVVIYFQQKR